MCHWSETVPVIRKATGSKDQTERFLTPIISRLLVSNRPRRPWAAFLFTADYVPALGRMRVVFEEIRQQLIDQGWE